MKTLYPNRTYNAHARSLKDSHKKSVLFFLFILLTVFAFARNGNTKPDSKVALPESGTVVMTTTSYASTNTFYVVNAGISTPERLYSTCLEDFYYDDSLRVIQPLNFLLLQRIFPIS